MKSTETFEKAPALDLYALDLFRRVAAESSFTRAAALVGLTQSAVTRQIASLESRVGAVLFERSTRRVRLTPAGRLLLGRARGLLAAAEDALRHFRRDLELEPPTLRVGVSRSIGYAYFPGYFFAFRRRCPRVQLQVMQMSSPAMLDAVENGSLDAALLSPPPRIPRGLEATHRFADEFVFIAPPDMSAPPTGKAISPCRLRGLASGLPWLLLETTSQTGRGLRRWMKLHGWIGEPAMELDGFDPIVNLVALGLGVSFVPHRVLALYGARRKVRRIVTRPRFSRELAVVVRRNRVQPPPLADFLASVLF